MQLPATLPTDTPMRSRWAPIWRRSPRSWPCLNSGYRAAQLRSTPVAALYRSRITQQGQLGAKPVHHPTRQLTRQPGDCSEPASGSEPEHEPITGQFAGIAIEEFIWARQHARRMVLVWVSVVLAITGLVASAAWTIGSNLSGLL